LNSYIPILTVCYVDRLRIHADAIFTTLVIMCGAG